jgi:hypothetical protein
MDLGVRHLWNITAESGGCVLYRDVALDGDLDEVGDCQDRTGVVRHKYI